MTTTGFLLPAELEAREPAEARGLTRDGVRLLVGSRSTGEVSHHRFTELPALLRAGDVLVVNTSATIPAAVPVVGGELTLHLSTERQRGPHPHPPAGGRGAGPTPHHESWLVELRRLDGKATAPYTGGAPGSRYHLLGGGQVRLRERYSRERLWVADVTPAGFGSVLDYLNVFGAPIRYSYVSRPWQLRYYQTVFGREPGSAEMPSASRPFTDRVVTRLVAAGVQFAPVVLHTGVASPEAHERPYPERFEVPETSARVVNAARAAGGRVIAIGTTAVRAVESAVDGSGAVVAAGGWTELIVTPDRGVRAIDGLLTGFHEPRASHLDMLAAIAGPNLLDHTYAAAIRAGYLWHEFGDVNLLLP